MAVFSIQIFLKSCVNNFEKRSLVPGLPSFKLINQMWRSARTDHSGLLVPQEAAQGVAREEARGTIRGRGKRQGQPSAEAAATGWMLQVGRVPGSAKRESEESSQAPDLLLLHSHIGRGEPPQSAKT